jgi:hypothetical protein
LTCAANVSLASTHIVDIQQATLDAAIRLARGGRVRSSMSTGRAQRSIKMQQQFL